MTKLKNFSIWYTPGMYSLHAGLRIPVYGNGEPQRCGECIALIKATSWSEAKIQYERIMKKHYQKRKRAEAKKEK